MFVPLDCGNVITCRQMGEKMADIVEKTGNDQVDYGALYKTDRPTKVIKKDGSKEDFNVQKVIDAVGKSAYRALTKFTEEEKRHICDYVVEKVNELDESNIPIPMYIRKASPLCILVIRKMQIRIQRSFPQREALFLTS